MPLGGVQVPCSPARGGRNSRTASPWRLSSRATARRANDGMRWLAVLDRSSCASGPRAGHRHLRRQLGTHLPTDMSRRAAAARLAAAACAAMRLHIWHRWIGWGRWRRRYACAALRHAVRRDRRTGTQRGAGPGRRELGAARLDGAWLPWLAESAAGHRPPLQPSNCGFDVALAERASAHALRRRAAEERGAAHRQLAQRGEFVPPRRASEGSPVYAVASSFPRDAIAAAKNRAVAEIDLLPERSTASCRRSDAPARLRSMSTHC